MLYKIVVFSINKLWIYFTNNISMIIQETRNVEFICIVAIYILSISMYIVSYD